MIALFATAMVACDKDDDNNSGNNNGGGNNTPEGNSIAQVGRLAVPLTAGVEFNDFGEASFQGMYASENENIRVHFGAGIAWESLGKTIDLSSPQMGEYYWFRYEEWSENEYDFTQNNYLDGAMSSWLNQGERSDTPIFSSGTLSTTRTDEGYTLVIEGVLVDGTSVNIKLQVPYTEEIIPLTQNSVIYDGVKYEFSTTASQNGGTGNVSWNSVGGNNVTSSGTVYQGSNNLHIFLQDNPTGDGYYFDFDVTVPGLQLSYRWDNDQLTGTLNGEPFTSTPFTEGDAETQAYYNELKVTVVGTLSNGKVLKLYVSSPY